MLCKALIISSLIVLLTHLRTCEVSGNECGRFKFVDPKIVKGAATVRGAWPFLAALHYIEEAKFFCGATLISSKNILTAAHCIQQKGSTRKLQPADVAVLLGAYNLNRKIEIGTEQREVEDIYIHPDWRAFNERYDADLAILVLREMVKFTRYIHPICLPSDDPPIHTKGSIVGWGLSEKSLANMLEHESIPRQAYTTILNDSYCYTNQDFLALFSSTRVFCGGGDGGTPNKGDSGGGLFVLSGSTWTQYGIISASLADSSGSTLPDAFSLYTNVRAFKSWIDETVVKSGSDVMSVVRTALSDVMSVVEMETVKVTFSCDYQYPDYDIYSCVMRAVNVTSANSEVDLVTGTQVFGKNEDDVTDVSFWTGTLNYIPNGISKKFKFLKRFLVGGFDRKLGLKRLQRSNFEGMELLWDLNVNFNNVDTVDEDTLWDLPNLLDFDIRSNKLKMLHKNTFARNGKLRVVNAQANQLEFLPLDLFKNNPVLEYAFFHNNNLKIISTDFTHLSSIKKIDFHGNSCINDALEIFRRKTYFQLRRAVGNSSMVFTNIGQC